MMVIEEHTHQVIQSTLPKIADALKKINGTLEVMAQVPEYHPKEDPVYCMSFVEWVERLEFSDRRRLMNFLWNNEDWHSTCLREEDAPYADPNSHKLPQ